MVGRILLAVIATLLLMLGCVAESPSYEKNLFVKTEFDNGGRIPVKYTCDGADVSPPIEIDGLRSDVKSLVIICEDPDAPFGVFTHWIAWNIEPVNVIPENIPKKAEVQNPRMVQGKNDFGKIGYNGPCPPPGKTHRYYFKIYALDTVLEGHYTKDSLKEAIKDHVVQYGEIYGVYSRTG
jgi:hypothetical protein